MSWKVVRIRAPEYIVQHDNGKVVCYADGKPDIRYSEQSAKMLRNQMNEADARLRDLLASS